MRRPAWLLALCVTAAQADWQWSPALQVGEAGTALFPHLDASGRKSIAVSGDTVALAWEDSRTGSPRCRLGLKRTDDKTFHEFSFGRGECFEPGLAPLDPGRFLLAWEDETGVNAAVASAAGTGTSVRLAPRGGHAAVAYRPGLGAFAAWSAPEGRWQRTWLARLGLVGSDLTQLAARPADPAPPADDQLYPVLAVAESGVTLAWEDRRLGHTVVLAVRSQDGIDWAVPLRISENRTGKTAGDLGRGMGAMRPSLAAFGQRIGAVWLDKRDFLSGYDVYAAIDAGQGFDTNLKTQDSFGDAIAQWHAAAAGNARGDWVIAFDDDRDGTADVWLTWWNGTGFADNVSPPPAYGPGHQSDPAIALDEVGNLHLAWIERADDGRARILYARGVRPQTANKGSEKLR